MLIVRNLVLLAVFFVLIVGNVFAGQPFVNLEGVGGIALNPLAYLADSDGENSHFKIADIEVVGKPRFGFWYIRLSNVKADWTSVGVADTFFKRLEVSYGYEAVNQKAFAVKEKNNVGTKLLILPENSFGLKFIPAISVGGIFKHTSEVGIGVKTRGQDVYGVATKLITLLPRPVLLSAGAVYTNGQTTGVFGYNKDRKTVGFGNVDVILPWNLVVGFEYKQGPRYPNWKDANYWDAHFVWMPTKNLTFFAAYVYAGDYKKTSRVGLGDGPAVSVQYAF